MGKKSNKAIEMEILNRVQAYLKDQGVPLGVLARSLGMTYDQLFQKLYNRQTIDISTYIQICRYLDVSPDYFVNGLI